MTKPNLNDMLGTYISFVAGIDDESLTNSEKKCVLMSHILTEAGNAPYFDGKSIFNELLDNEPIE